MDSVFDKRWFERHQQKLLWLANHPIIGGAFRHRLGMPPLRILKILPNCFYSSLGNPRVPALSRRENQFRGEFYTRAVIARRLYNAFRPVWWGMHAWDSLLADRRIPELKFGFDTLTLFTTSGNPASDGCDGDVFAGNGSTTYTTYAGAHDAVTGDGINNQGGQILLIPRNRLSATLYQISRGLMNWDTSSIPRGATVSAATITLRINGTANVDSDSVRIVRNTIVSDNAYAVGDYAKFGTTAQAADKTIASFTGLPANFDFTLTDLTGINPSGFSHYGIRTVNDVNNVAPTGDNRVEVFAADLSNPPKLVITFDPPPPSARINLGAVVSDSSHQPYRYFESMILT